MTEEWKPIKGYEGLYEVSNYGKVKSLSKLSGTCLRKDRELSLNRLSIDGYVRIALTRSYDVYEAKMHRLVAEHFIPNPECKETVNHIDGNKQNNRVDNLEWADRHEQLQHAYNLNLKKAPRGINSYAAKLTEEDVRYIRSNYKCQSTEFGTVALGKMFGVTNVVIGHVVRGETYKNVE